MWLAAEGSFASLVWKGVKIASKLTAVPAVYFQAASWKKSRWIVVIYDNKRLSLSFSIIYFCGFLKKMHFKTYTSTKTRPQVPDNNRQVLQRREGRESEQTARERRQRGILCEILPKVYGRLKGLKAWRKLDQGESSPNFHYFQVVWLN